jgi:hypothetical protein
MRNLLKFTTFLFLILISLFIVDTALAVCSDTDGGQDPYTQGTCNNPGQAGSPFTDSCETTSILREWFCNEEGMCDSILFDCSTIGGHCDNGICVVPTGGEGGGGSVGGGGKLGSILTKIKDALKSLGYIVCVIFMIWGGYQMITSSGDPTKFEKGKTTLLYAAIGFVVILLADAIVNLIKSIVGG